MGGYAAWRSVLPLSTHRPARATVCVFVGGWGVCGGGGACTMALCLTHTVYVNLPACLFLCVSVSVLACACACVCVHVHEHTIFMCVHILTTHVACLTACLCVCRCICQYVCV